MTCPSCSAETDAALRTCQRCKAALPVAPGWLIAGRYEILANLGAGGMGMIFRAHDRALDVRVALKVVRLAQDPRAVKRFHHEVTLARKIKHRNVCSIYEYGEDEGVVYCTMELIEGLNLRQLIRERGPLRWEQAYDMALQVCEGLKAIHEAGVVHRDVKSTNIMLDALDPHGLVRVVDFGIAKDVLPPEHTPPSGTDSGWVVGSPEYMSPEQVRREPLDARSDIYSLGVVLFEAFTGHVPFHGDTPVATMMMHLEAPAPLSGPDARKLPRALVPVLRRALAKEATQRQQTTAELAQELQGARNTLPVEATGSYTFRALARPVPRLKLGLFAAAALSVPLGVYLFNHWPRSGGREDVRVGTGPSGPPATPPIPSPTSRQVPMPTPTLTTAPTATPKPRRTPTSKPRTTPMPSATPAPAPTLAPSPPSTPMPTAAPTPGPTPIPAARPAEIVPATCVHCPEPLYPPVAERLGLEGDVEVALLVGEDGRVAEARVLAGDRRLHENALKAVRVRRYRPATREGHPVASRLIVTVSFRLTR